MMDSLSSKSSSVRKIGLDNVELSWPWIILAVALMLTIAHTLRVVYQPGLRVLPGHWLTSFSRLYKIYLVYDGRCPEKQRAMHQKYAFDVIGCITFQSRVGFMEQRKDIADMIAVIGKVLMYGAVIGQVPQLQSGPFRLNFSINHR
ncbi:hypothetical protein EYB26_006452 [Talaromyces marneffei]|uniref:uncharacterized protein n=1 Tax=Talaromyces marneffei TaxID=37727 RepID=UPI0012AA974E|nr:uncharacterized protein EYB26_006452 [Talaromyces marneffei]QGA18767.1 hypothetical protein EYB26_006452 [Talaromyces marneffei]